MTGDRPLVVTVLVSDEPVFDFAFGLKDNNHNKLEILEAIADKCCQELTQKNVLTNPVDIIEHIQVLDRIANEYIAAIYAEVVDHNSLVRVVFPTDPGFGPILPLYQSLAEEVIRPEDYTKEDWNMRLHLATSMFPSPELYQMLPFVNKLSMYYWTIPCQKSLFTAFCQNVLDVRNHEMVDNLWKIVVMVFTDFYVPQTPFQSIEDHNNGSAFSPLESNEAQNNPSVTSREANEEQTASECRDPRLRSRHYSGGQWPETSVESRESDSRIDGFINRNIISSSRTHYQPIRSQKDWQQRMDWALNGQPLGIMCWNLFLILKKTPFKEIERNSEKFSEYLQKFSPQYQALHPQLWPIVEKALIGTDETQELIANNGCTTDNDHEDSLSPPSDPSLVCPDVEDEANQMSADVRQDNEEDSLSPGSDPSPVCSDFGDEVTTDVPQDDNKSDSDVECNYSPHRSIGELSDDWVDILEPNEELQSLSDPRLRPKNTEEQETCGEDTPLPDPRSDSSNSDCDVDSNMRSSDVEVEGEMGIMSEEKMDSHLVECLKECNNRLQTSSENLWQVVSQLMKKRLNDQSITANECYIRFGRLFSRYSSALLSSESPTEAKESFDLFDSMFELDLTSISLQPLPVIAQPIDGRIDNNSDLEVSQRKQTEDEDINDFVDQDLDNYEINCGNTSAVTTTQENSNTSDVGVSHEIGIQAEEEEEEDMNDFIDQQLDKNYNIDCDKTSLALTSDVEVEEGISGTVAEDRDINDFIDEQLENTLDVTAIRKSEPQIDEQEDSDDNESDCEPTNNALDREDTELTDLMIVSSPLSEGEIEDSDNGIDNNVCNSDANSYMTAIPTTSATDVEVRPDSDPKERRIESSLVECLKHIDNRLPKSFIWEEISHQMKNKLSDQSITATECQIKFCQLFDKYSSALKSREAEESFDLFESMSELVLIPLLDKTNID